MKKIYNVIAIAALGAAAVTPLMTSCSNDDYDTQQYKGGVNLNVWGPRPVARGGELRFLGSGMDQITSISIPGAGDVTDIKVVSGEEIRITVPQTSEEGKVVLHHSGGEITSLTELSFTEPISIEEIAPMIVKPGAVLTISGDYLNLIEEVIFTDNVVVAEDDFITHTRQEISLTVPAEAQTGQIIISDGATPLPNWIYSEDEVEIVLPSVERVADLSGVKPGETVTFTVKNLDLVKSVVMPEGQEVDFGTEDDKLTFVLPENVTDGTICMVPASGVKVALATIGVALPEEVVAEPADNIWSGDVIKFKGVNMELVTSVSFPNVEEAVAPATQSATEITVTVPEGTQSGNAVLRTASGGAVDVAISTLKPEAVSYNPNPVALASSLTISGRNLQYVVAVVFNGDTQVGIADPASDSFSLTVPPSLAAGSTSVAFTLTNGESVEAPAIELTAPECAYATGLPEDVILAGTTITLNIVNADKLTGVEVNGTAVQYILNGNTLMVQIPSSARAGSQLTLLSSNGSISYTIDVLSEDELETVIWDAGWVCSNWGGNQDLAWGGYDWSTVKEGQILRFYITPTMPDGEWWCISLRHGDGWNALPDPIPSQYDNPASPLEVELTQNVIDDLVANGGLVITGSEYQLDKITIQ
jgi:hypothetical protein